MRKSLIVTGFTVVALVATEGTPVHAQSTTGKAKSMTQDAKTELSDSWITSKIKIALFADHILRI